MIIAKKSIQKYFNTINQNMLRPKLLSPLIQQNRYCYIKAKDIENVKQLNSHLGIVKVISKTVSYILSQIMASFKLDWKQFIRIRKVPQIQRTIQDRYLYRQIRLDLIKFGPAICIFNIPFGLPLFYFYLRFFPQLIPSWMMIDTFHEKIIQSRKSKRIAAYKYYFEGNSLQLGLAMIKQTLFKPYKQLADLRRISSLCLGYYEDGTFYITQKTGIQFSKGMFFEGISKQIIIQKLLKQIDNDYVNQGQYSGLQAEQKMFKKACIQVVKLKQQLQRSDQIVGYKKQVNQ